MPRPQLLPLLPCDIDNSSNVSSGFQSSSSSSSSSFNTKQTVTYKLPVKIKKEEPDEVSKANTVYSFEPKIYNQVTPKKEEKTQSEPNRFFSGLNNQVKVMKLSVVQHDRNENFKIVGFLSQTINFNSKSNEPIQGLVTLHKRERTTSTENDASPERLASSAKKRKFKIVANDSQTSEEKLLSSNVSGTTPDIKPNIKPDIQPSAPENLKDLMKLVRKTTQFSCVWATWLNNFVIITAEIDTVTIEICVAVQSFS